MKENKGEQPEQERERMKLPPELEKYIDKDPICSTELFAELKWAIGNFMWFHIKMNSDKTAIECNPASHAIAKYVYNKLTAAQPSKVQEKEERPKVDWEMEYWKQFNENDGLKKEIEELKSWKQSAISVMPDMQAIGKALNVPLGQSVHDKILPGIERLNRLIRIAFDKSNMWRGEAKEKIWDEFKKENNV